MFISCLLQLRHNCRDENFALKRIVRLKTPSTYKPDELFPSVQHVSNLLNNSIGRAVNFEDLTNLVTKRLQTLRTERFSTQVEAFADEFRVKANPETDYANFFDHAFRQGWNTCKVGSWQDGKIKSKLHKTLLDYREGKSARKPRGAPSIRTWSTRAVSQTTRVGNTTFYTVRTHRRGTGSPVSHILTWVGA